MTADILHHPDTHRLGKQDAKPPHAMLREFVDIERLVAEGIPANVVNSLLPTGAQIALAMYLNDQYGDCTCAGMGNTLRVDSDDSIQITDQDVEAAYVAVTGQEGAAFSPGPPPVNDNGCVEVDVLDYATTVGFGGVKILGHAGIDMTNLDEARTALYLTGSIYAGFALSTDNQSQPIWEPGPAAAGSWGGHCPPIFDWYTQIPADLVIGGVPIPPSLGQVLALGTWGAYKAASEPYLPFACDEGHALITQAWLDRNQGNPAIDLAKLTGYLNTLQPDDKPAAAAPNSEPAEPIDAPASTPAQVTTVTHVIGA